MKLTDDFAGNYATEDHRVNIGKYIIQTRLKEIKHYNKFLFEDEMIKEIQEPELNWNKIEPLIRHEDDGSPIIMDNVNEVVMDE